MQVMLNSAVSALNSYSVGMAVTADNLANINTPHYKAGVAHYETGPEGYGVQVGELTRDPSAGPPTPASPTDTYTPGTEAYASFMEGSNVSIEREFVNMIMNEHAYTANASVISTYDDMAGTLINMIA